MHLPVLARLRDRGVLTLAVVCDVVSERAAAARKNFGFMEASTDGAAALRRSDIDAAYILGSAQLHYEYGMLALRNGKHLFVEKPVAPSYAQASELARLASTNGLIAAGGHNRRFYRALAAARVHAGRAGWRFAEAVFHKSESGRPPPFGARTWLGANGIHALDALLMMMGGLPEQLTAVVGEAGAADPAMFCAVMRWANGSQGVFLCNNNAGARREEYVFHGYGETCTVTDAELIFSKSGSVLRTPFPALGDGVAAEHEAFVQAIQAGVAPLNGIDAIAPSLFLAELIESGHNGRVRLPETEPPATAVTESAVNSILVVEPAALQPALTTLLSRYRLVSLDEVRKTAQSRPDIVAAILGRGASCLPEDVLARLPGLTVVGIAGLSFARYAPESLLARDIALVNASAAYARSVAEFALGLAILGRRRAFLSHEIMRRGGWGIDLRRSGWRGRLRWLAQQTRPFARAAGLERFFVGIWRKGGPLVEGSGAQLAEASQLQGATVALIGWGANARAFAGLLAGLRARVLVYSEHASSAEIRRAGAAPASLGEALSADIVSLHRGLNRSTRHFLGVAELDKLRPGTILINIARGALIDPVALLTRLRRGDIFACLDTYEEEPMRALHPLRRLPNVFLTSHIAGGSADMHAAAAEEVVQKVAACLAGQAVEPVSAGRLRTMS